MAVKTRILRVSLVWSRLRGCLSLVKDLSQGHYHRLSIRVLGLEFLRRRNRFIITFMNKVLLILVIPLLALNLFAQSEEQVEPDKSPSSLLAKDVFFQPGAGIRVRYDFLDGATGGAFPADERETQATHRAQFDLKIYKGEYIETFFRFINTAEWGGSSGDTNGGQKNGFTNNNGLLVNQAWGLWKFDELIGLKFGRVPLDYGLGYT